MKKTLLFAIMILAIGAAFTLFCGFAPAASGVAYAEELSEPVGDAEPLVEQVYTWSDAGGGYELTLTSSTLYTLVATKGAETVSISGNYSITDNQLTIYFNGEVFSTYLIDGTAVSEITPAGEIEETPSFSARMDEWFDKNLPEFLSGLSVAISGIFMSVILPYLRKKMSSVNATVLTNSSSQEAVVGVVNKLIEKYNEVEAKLGELDNKEVSRDALQAQFAICQKAILEILTTVYNNSKNIPQVTKDLVNLQYVKVLKTENETAEVLKENGGE